MKMKVFPNIYDISIAKKAKLTVGFLAFPLVNFFKTLHILSYKINATLNTLFFEEALYEQFSLMAKNKKSCDIRETV